MPESHDTRHAFMNLTLTDHLGLIYPDEEAQKKIASRLGMSL